MNNNETNRTESSLIDPFGRRIDYIRLSVTDKCNLRCFYCLPKGFKDFDIPDDWLTFDEIERVIRAFAEMGVARVRITGGEPLVRKNLSQLINKLDAIPEINDLSLSTNATLLEKHAHDLKQSGIARINVSLDTLRPERFAEITGGSPLQPVIDGLMAAKNAGLTPIKINMVAMKGINDDEFEEMVDFCAEHKFTLRMIETMPIGSTGQEAGKHFISLQEVKAQLGKRFDLIPSVMSGGGPARYMRVNGTDLKIGFITPLTQHFCETCNRVRLSADGTLYLCMGQNHTYELRPLLRQGISDSELKEKLQEALALKPKEHHFNDEPDQVVRFMSKLGG